MITKLYLKQANKQKQNKTKINKNKLANKMPEVHLYSIKFTAGVSVPVLGNNIGLRYVPQM